ncbi:MAG: protein translocase subunit SecF [Desulfovibrio sp.]|nr:protein translocase subunit SecF [Desulfovibrio sp.]
MALQFVKDNANIDFIGKRWLGFLLSAALIVMSLVVMLAGSGLRMGIDFAGGVIAQVQFKDAIADEALKKGLDKYDLAGLPIHSFGDTGKDYLLRFSSGTESSVSLRTRIEDSLRKGFAENPATIERLEVVGPKVGKDLTEKGLNALFYAILIIAVYISGRFEQRWMAGAAMAACLWGGTYVLGQVSTHFLAGSVGTGALVCFALGVTLVVCFLMRLNFALGAIVCLMHDVCISLGVLAVMGVDVDLNVLAAILTIIGYSLNDTIIVYDRLRENLRTQQDKPLDFLINRSINQTLARTVLTSGTTIMATLALFILGGGVIHSFALTMLVGVVIGTYSSIYVASPILLALGSTEFYVRAAQKPEYEKPGEHGIV